MSDLIVFIQHNLLLVLGILVVVGILMVLEIKEKGAGKLALMCTDAVKKINHDSSLILDIRSRKDFDKGHIVNAINIPAEECVITNTKLKKYENKSIILVCASGEQSQTQLKKLQSMHFKQVFYIQGGLKNWLNEELPVVSN